LAVTFTTSLRTLDLQEALKGVGAHPIHIIVWHYDVSIGCRKSDDEKTSAKLRKTGK
jgi:hypothetical protein